MKVGGRDFNMTRGDVEARMQGTEPELIQKHAVEVNGEWYPPKQVLGEVTGWPRTSFTTMEAQRVLARIGFVCSEARGAGIRQAGEYVVDVLRDSVRQTMSDHGDSKYLQGFTQAAGISLRRIQDRLDGLREQMKASGLSPAGQAVYAHLDEVRSEIEEDCDRYWQGAGVDWRPPKPVARAIRRHADDAEA